MKNKTYYIYHIPDYVWSDGSVGKIGCTHNVKKRMKEQNFTKWEILEEWDCKYKASDREIELQKEYGYKVDKVPYWKTLKAPKDEIRKQTAKRLVKSGHMFVMADAAKKANRKPLIQYDLEGNFIKEWEGLNVAQKELGIVQIHTSIPYKGTRGGFFWLYKGMELDKDKLRKSLITTGVPILQYDKKGNFIKEWERIIDAANELGLHAQNINRVLKGGAKTTGGYTFKYKE